MCTDPRALYDDEEGSVLYPRPRCWVVGSGSCLLCELEAGACREKGGIGGDRRGQSQMDADADADHPTEQPSLPSHSPHIRRPVLKRHNTFHAKWAHARQKRKNSPLAT